MSLIVVLLLLTTLTSPGLGAAWLILQSGVVDTLSRLVRCRLAEKDKQFARTAFCWTTMNPTYSHGVCLSKSYRNRSCRVRPNQHQILNTIQDTRSSVGVDSRKLMKRWLESRKSLILSAKKSYQLQT